MNTDSTKELLSLDDLLTSSDSPVTSPQVVVRLRRSCWYDGDGAYQRTSLRYLRRHAKGFNFFDEDCSMIGAEEVLPRIVNLEECKDGVYQIVPCNERFDWETGLVDTWDYKLLPFTPSDSSNSPSK